MGIRPDENMFTNDNKYYEMRMKSDEELIRLTYETYKAVDRRNALIVGGSFIMVAEIVYRTLDNITQDVDLWIKNILAIFCLILHFVLCGLIFAWLNGKFVKNKAETHRYAKEELISRGYKVYVKEYYKYDEQYSYLVIENKKGEIMNEKIENGTL